MANRDWEESCRTSHEEDLLFGDQAKDYYEKLAKEEEKTDESP
jgi:hypothetical protein